MVSHLSSETVAISFTTGTKSSTEAVVSDMASPEEDAIVPDLASTDPSFGTEAVVASIFDEYGFDEKGNHQNGTRYDEDGYDVHGYDEYDFDWAGIHRNGTRYDEHGYNVFDYNEHSYDSEENHLDTGTILELNGRGESAYYDIGVNCVGLTLTAKEVDDSSRGAATFHTVLQEGARKVDE